MSKTLSPAQRKALAYAATLSADEVVFVNSYPVRIAPSTLGVLNHLGLVEVVQLPYLDRTVRRGVSKWAVQHGTFRITDAGREAVEGAKS